MNPSRAITLKRAVAGACLAALAAAGVAATTTALAQAKPSPAERAIKYRQSALYLLGWNIGPISAMVKGEMPYDAKALEMRATRLAQIAPMIAEGFPAGSDKGAPTKAKPEIWQNLDDFKQKAADLEAATAKLASVAKSGDLKQIGPVVGEGGAACKACHDRYKAD